MKFAVIFLLLFVSCDKKPEAAKNVDPPVDKTAPPQKQLEDLSRMEREKELKSQGLIKNDEDESAPPPPLPVTRRPAPRPAPVVRSVTKPENPIRSVDLEALKSLIKPCGEGEFHATIGIDGSVTIKMEGADRKVLSCITGKIFRVRFDSGVVRRGTIKIP
ncbi:hypothetical protein KKF34_12330 [Myxococcota bacterium]|nr:hypothetical protein [Myxococcota bacterium]MBU1382011.1 hypothetical protein [Myxococcota bacterium]MBU1497652.1 hypothetical protein [Myxococcota bacterium]